MSLPRPDPARDERWVTLEDAAAALHLTQQALWQRLRESRIEVRRIDVGGRQVSGLSGGDLARLGASQAPQRTDGANGSKPARVQPEGEPRADEEQAGVPSLWQQLREFEMQRDQLGFELHIVRTQLADARARAQQVEEAQRAVSTELELSRAELEAARAEIERWRREFEGLIAERADARSARDAARAQSTAIERQMNKLIEVENARERYCDRLEQRLRSLGAA